MRSLKAVGVGVFSHLLAVALAGVAYGSWEWAQRCGWLSMDTACNAEVFAGSALPPVVFLPLAVAGLAVWSYAVGDSVLGWLVEPASAADGPGDCEAFGCSCPCHEKEGSA